MVLFSLFELLSQLDEVGKGSYQMSDAFIFVALTLPKRLLDLMPISTLLGGIIALGLLADHGNLSPWKHREYRLCEYVPQYW